MSTEQIKIPVSPRGSKTKVLLVLLILASDSYAAWANPIEEPGPWEGIGVGWPLIMGGIILSAGLFFGGVWMVRCWRSKRPK